MVLVRPWIWRTRPSVSRRSFHQRSDHRAWSSRSLHPWQGCARRARRRSAMRFSWLGSAAPRPKSWFRFWPGAGGRFSRSALRAEEARSRRDLGTLALKDLGMRILVTGAMGPSRSSVPILRSWLSSVRTAGRGSRLPWSELRTTAGPGARPPGTLTTSPGSKRASESSLSDFCTRDLVRDVAFSASDSSLRSRAYSVKSPRWQVMDLAYPARDSSLLRTCRARPTTERSAWNWAKDDSRI